MQFESSIPIIIFERTNNSRPSVVANYETDFLMNKKFFTLFGFSLSTFNFHDIKLF